MEQPIHLTDAEYEGILAARAGAARRGGRTHCRRGWLEGMAHAALDRALLMLLVGLIVIMGSIVLYDRVLAPLMAPSPAGAPAAPTAAVSFVAPSGGYAPQPASGGDPAPAADGAALVAPTPEPPPPTATPEPTADLARQADVDALANAADLAAGGNPAAATPLPAGPVDLPTAVIGPVDPSGGDVSTLARACANSGVKAGCEHPLTAEEIRQLACAMDLASSGQDCAPIEVRP